MGAQLCKDCFSFFKKNKPPHSPQIHQLVDLSKNPAADMSQEKPNKLSFMLDHHPDQSYMSDEHNPKEDEDSQYSATVESTKNSLPKKQDEKQRLIVQSPQPLKQGSKTEEEEVEECKSEPTSCRIGEPDSPFSAREKLSEIVMFATRPTVEQLVDIGEEALENLKEFIDDVVGFEKASSFLDNASLQMKSYQNHNKFHVHKFRL